MSTLSETIKDFNIDELVAVYYLSKSKDRNAEASSLSDEQKKAVIAVLPEMHSMEVILALENRKREIELADREPKEEPEETEEEPEEEDQEPEQEETEEEPKEPEEEPEPNEEPEDIEVKQEPKEEEQEPEETETAAQSEEKKSVSTVSDE